MRSLADIRAATCDAGDEALCTDPHACEDKRQLLALVDELKLEVEALANWAESHGCDVQRARELLSRL